MRALRIVLAALCVLTFGLGAQAAAAGTAAQSTEISGRAKAAVPGAPGWLYEQNPSGGPVGCYGTFNLNNWIASNNAFTAATGSNPTPNSPWAWDGTVNVTSITDTDAPISADPAMDFSVGPITAGSHSGLYTTPTMANSAGIGWTIQADVQDLSTGVPGQLYLIARNTGGTIFKSEPIPNDGNAHTVVLNVPTWWFSYTAFVFEVGGDRRDTTETNLPGTSATKSVRIAHVQAIPFVRGPGRFLGDVKGGAWPYIGNNATTTAPLTKTGVQIPCTPGMAFRSWDKVTPWIANGNANWNSNSGITLTNVQNPNLAYQEGGASMPFFGGNSLQATGPYAGYRLGHVSMTDGEIQGAAGLQGAHNDWYADGLFYGHGIFDIQDLLGGVPAFTIPGSVASPGVPYSITNLSYTAGTGVLVITPASMPSPATQVGAAVTLSGVTPSTFNIPSWKVTAVGASTITVAGPTGLATPSNSGTLGVPNDGIITATGCTITGTALSCPQSGISPGLPLASMRVSGVGITTTTKVSTTAPNCNGTTCTATLTQSWTLGPETLFFTENLTNYMLHPWWVPRDPVTGMACKDPSGASHPLCIHFSGNGSNNGTFLAYADTPAGPWNIYMVNGTPAYALPDSQGTYENFPELPTNIAAYSPFGTSTSSGPANVLIEITQGTGTAQGNGVGNYAFPLWQYNLGDATINTAKYLGSATQGVLSTDWDQQQGAANRLDPGIYLNRCGFYEMYYTAYQGSPQFGAAVISTSSYNAATGQLTLTTTGTPTLLAGQPVTFKTLTFTSGTWTPGAGTYQVLSVNGTTTVVQIATGLSAFVLSGGQAQLSPKIKNQAIGEFISDSPLGPWFLYQGPVIPLLSALYNNITTIGESNVYHDGALIYWMGNTDSGTAFSSGVGGYMTDACVASPMAANDNFAPIRFAANDNAVTDRAAA